MLPEGNAAVPTPRLTVDRYADEIEAQAALFRSHLQDADLATPVPTCPGWNLAQLTQHLGAGFRWLDDLVRTRAAGPTDDTAMRVLDPAPQTDARARGEWLVVGAEELADALRAAGPSASMWTPLPGAGADFFARRYAHETLMHSNAHCVFLDFLERRYRARYFGRRKGGVLAYRCLTWICFRAGRKGSAPPSAP